MSVTELEGAPGTALQHKLCAARVEHGLTLEDASAQSGVPLRYVRMFEDGRYPMVSDPVYLTHFVRRYAACLGLNELLTASEFVEEIVSTKEAPPLPPVAGETLRRECLTSIRSKRGRSPGRLLSFYAGPLSVIAVAWAIGPLSPLNQSLEQPPAVSVVEGHREPSAVLLAMLTEPREELVPASLLPPASQTPTKESPPAPIEAPLPTTVEPQLAEVPTEDLLVEDLVSKPEPVISDERSATNKASDDLRAEQLERLKMRMLPPAEAAGAADGA